MENKQRRSLMLCKTPDLKMKSPIPRSMRSNLSVDRVVARNTPSSIATPENAKKTTEDNLWYRRGSIVQKDQLGSIEDIVKRQLLSNKDNLSFRCESILSKSSRDGSQVLKSFCDDSKERSRSFRLFNIKQEMTSSFKKSSPARFLRGNSPSKVSSILNCNSHLDIEMESHASPATRRRRSSIYPSDLITRIEIRQKTKIPQDLQRMSAEYMQKFSSDSNKQKVNPFQSIKKATQSPLDIKCEASNFIQEFRNDIEVRVSRFNSQISSNKPKSAVKNESAVLSPFKNYTSCMQETRRSTSKTKVNRKRRAQRRSSKKSLTNSNFSFNPAIKYEMKIENEVEEVKTPKFTQKSSSKISDKPTNMNKRNLKLHRKSTDVTMKDIKSQRSSVGPKSRSRSKNSNSKNTVQKLKCPYCDKSFSAQGLGGHKAKAHPGKNLDYKNKMETRKKNAKNLKILREAQNRIRLDLNKPELSKTDMPRSLVEKYKQKVREDLEAGIFSLSDN